MNKFVNEFNEILCKSYNFLNFNNLINKNNF